MKHRTQILSCLSTLSIQSTDAEPLEELGQGNSGGPKGWLTQDTVISTTYYQLTGASITIKNPPGNRVFHQYKISYVDDNKLLFELPSNDFSISQTAITNV